MTAKNMKNNNNNYMIKKLFRNCLHRHQLMKFVYDGIKLKRHDYLNILR